MPCSSSITRAISRDSQHSSNPQADRSRSDSEDGLGSRPDSPVHAEAPAALNSSLTMSLADVKLANQKKRIEKADAALNAFGKCRASQRLDAAADVSFHSPTPDGAVSVDDELTDDLSPATHDHSCPCSECNICQRPPGRIPSDTDHDDLSQIEDGSFKLCAGRKVKRNALPLGPHENKLGDKQTTGEAAGDRREIYNVFGNALPQPDHIEQNPGSVNGQVQFVQHPNGDVSAHQWCQSRYLWENIGQFSNLRSKVEGQLAADRLKGETADQTLQQHTLAYFRTIAKQREASVTGATFGPKEIQTLMPEPKPVSSTSFLTRKGVSAGRESEPPPKTLAHAHEPALTSFATPASQNYLGLGETFSYEHYPPYMGYPLPVSYDQLQYDLLRQILAGYHAEQRYWDNYLAANTAETFPDPFYSEHHHNFCGSSPTFHRQLAGNTDCSSSHRITGQQPGTDLYGSYSPPAQTFAATATTTATPISRHFGDGSLAASSRPEPVTPLKPQNSLLEKRTKATAQAKEKSLSYAGIGTVPYDQPVGQSPVTAEPSLHSVKQPQPELKRTVANPSGIVPLKSKGPISSLFDRRLVPVGNDKDFRNRKSSSEAPYTSPASNKDNLTRRTSSEQLFVDLPGIPDSADKSIRPDNKDVTNNERLNDRWNNSSTLARQKEFYRRIENAQKDASPFRSSSSSSAATPGHIGTKMQQSEPGSLAYAEEPMTRVFVPVLDNLTYYFQRSIKKRHDYFCPWHPPPEWCVDSSPPGNYSFFDSQ